MGTFDSQIASANALSIIGATLYAQSASASNPGMVNGATQTFAGNKLFPSIIQIANTQTIGATGTTAINVNTDGYNLINYTFTGATTSTLTLNNPTGTPHDSQKIIYAIQCTNVCTLAYGATFHGSSSQALVTVPTGASKIDYFGFQYSTINSLWNLLAINQGF